MSAVCACATKCADLALQRPAEALIYSNNTHTGPVRGLDFNNLQNNLLATGAVSGEVRICSDFASAL